MRTATYWRLRAEEIRTIRDDIVTPKPRNILARIAADYERLARLTDPADREAMMLRIGAHYADLTENGHAKE